MKSIVVSCFWLLVSLPASGLRAALPQLGGRVFIQGNSCAIAASGFSVTFSPEKGKNQQTLTTVTKQDGSFYASLTPGSYYVLISQGGYQVYGDTTVVRGDSLLRFTLRPADANSIQCPPSAESLCSELKLAGTLAASQFASIGETVLAGSSPVVLTSFLIPQFRSCELRMGISGPSKNAMECQSDYGGEFLDLETSIKSCLPNTEEYGTNLTSRRVTFRDSTGALQFVLTEESGGSILTISSGK
jgi:hypothetical protein